MCGQNSVIPVLQAGVHAALESLCESLITENNELRTMDNSELRIMDNSGLTTMTIAEAYKESEHWPRAI